MILGGFFDEKSIKQQCKIRTYFFNVFTSFMNECLMNAESPDPRSTREFSSKSQVAAFFSCNENLRKPQRIFDPKSLRKEDKSSPEIDEKAIESIDDVFDAFLMDFESQNGVEMSRKSEQNLKKSLFDFC